MRYYFDYIKLRKDDYANNLFNIVYTHNDLDDDSQVSLYYTTSETPSGGTLIAALPETRDSRVYQWNTSGIPNGTYYLYSIASDGVNATTRMASGPIIIDHAFPLPPTAPVLSVEAPKEGDTVCGALQVKGYALQADRFEEVASVEVLVDDSLFAVIDPSLYSPTAASAYPAVESSNSGFNVSYDTSSIAAGARTVTIRAYSTDGTETEQEVTITQAAAGCTPLLADPDPSGVPIAAGDTLNQSPDVSRPKIKRLRLNRKGLLTFDVAKSMQAGVGSCSLNFSVSDSPTGAETPAKSVKVTSANNSFKLKGLKINKANLSQFYLNVEKSCKGFNSKSLASRKKVKIKGKKGKISNVAGVASKFRRLKKGKKKKKRR